MSSTVFCNGVAVPAVDNIEYYFKNRMIVCFGSSGSGKSSVIIHIMNQLKSVIPLAVVACPTASLNGDYANLIPDQCIYNDVTRSLMHNIFKRQTSVMAMYDLVHNVKQLRDIYRLIADQESEGKVMRLTDIYRSGCDSIRQSYNEEDVKTAIDELSEKYNKKLTKIMRAQINDNIQSLQSRKLTDMQKSILPNININPCLLLLLDDVMASFKEWGGMEETRKLFYQGRHYGVMCIISCQSVVALPPAFRVNAHIIVFTTITTVNNYLNKASSGVPTDDKKAIAKIADTIFAPSQDRNQPNYRKLVLFGQIVKTEHKVQFNAGTPKKRRLGSAALWHLCEEIKKDV